MSDYLVLPASQWLIQNFGEELRSKSKDTPFSVSLLCAIACQESGYAWWRKALINSHRPSEILRLLVLDAVEPRAKAYPKDTAKFLSDPRFQDVAATLIQVSDASRRVRGVKPTGKLLFGYGIFQYDLQHIENDPGFWRDLDTLAPDQGSSSPQRGLWGRFSACMDRVLVELNTKYREQRQDIYQTIRSYNGSGPNAIEYARIIQRYEAIIKSGGL